ncbi:MAG: AmmeMemoRadiSam system protein A, partial [Bacillota bacterium]
SGDLSHKLKDDGPYGYHPSSIKFDTMVTTFLEKGEFLDLLNIDRTLIKEAAECGMRSFYTLAGVLDQTRFTGRLHSYEGPFGVGYAVISYTDINKADKSPIIDRYLEKEKKRVEINDKHASSAASLAKEAIKLQFSKTKSTVNTDDDFLLNTRAGCFVTLYSFGELRGCIGTMDAVCKNVKEEIVHNAKSAAFKDPRFSPVKESELPYITVSVDILGPLERIKDTTKLNPSQYGIMVEYNHKHGVLLPHIAGIDTVEGQLSAVLKKAGINPSDPYEIYRFEVMRYN